MAKKPKFELEPRIVKEENVQMNFYCPESIRAKLLRIAIEEDRTIGKQMVHIFREWLDCQEDD